MTARQRLVIGGGLVALMFASVASLAFGAVAVSPGRIVAALTGSADGPDATIVADVRLPRTLLAVIVGAALGLAGALLQGALANPLAAPDVVGVTAGAAFGAVAILLLAPASSALLPAAALGGGLVAAALVVLAAAPGPRGGGVGGVRIILAGIAVGALFTAATTAVMVWRSDRAPAAVVWLAGGLTGRGWEHLEMAAPYMLVGTVAAGLLARPLDLLALGDDLAGALGVRASLVRVAATAAAAVLAAAAAAVAGLLGFLGLVVPHIARLAGGPGHRYLLVASAVLGAAVLVAADTVARTALAPSELPVGVLTVALGVPFFLHLLRRHA
ncbi:MAG TPA: iron ABC transporter permease [Thermoleophilaceae bacterium]|nr:iron ABC transporter permease [Thermoleophilaceae bacterium]